MAYPYFDRRGAQISRAEWKTLRSDLDVCNIAFDEIETEGLAVKTVWFGIGPDVNSPSLIYTTCVSMTADLLAEYKTDMEVSGIMEAVHVRTEMEAIVTHEAVVARVYDGAYRTVMMAALGRLEPRYDDEA